MTMAFWYTKNETEYVVGRGDLELMHIPFDQNLEWTIDRAYDLARNAAISLNDYESRSYIPWLSEHNTAQKNKGIFLRY
jgi:hypothetical protein